MEVDARQYPPIPADRMPVTEGSVKPFGGRRECRVRVKGAITDRTKRRLVGGLFWSHPSLA